MNQGSHVTGLEGLQNFRDTGSTPLSHGGSTNPGVLYRSESLTGLTAGGLSTLANSGIGVVIDLRTPVERESAPDPLSSLDGIVTTVELPLLEGAVTGWARASADPDKAQQRITDTLAQLPSLGELYVAMLSDGAPTFAEVARLVASPPNPARPGVLVHCTAGKDRTGVACALLLDAVGASREAVIADYALSGERLAGPWADQTLAAMDALGIPRTAPVTEMAVGTPPAAMAETLRWVDERGGAVAYLTSGGLTTGEVAALRKRLAP